MRVGDEAAARIAAWPEDAWRVYQKDRGIAASASLDLALAQKDVACARSPAPRSPRARARDPA